MTQTQPGTLPAYHVLRERNDGGSVTYQPVDANVQARSAKEAIRKTAKETGRYVAVPARSFAPAQVTIATQTTVTIN